MTTIASNNYQNLFTGQTDAFLKSDEDVVLRLDMSNSQGNPGTTFVHQVCPVVISQENATVSDDLTELKTSEPVSGRGDCRFVCTYCHKLCHSESSLQNHLALVHRDCRRFICGFCGKAYAKSFLLKSHIKCVHESKSKDYSS
ncbi:hypothetical protein P879_05397 [Paragonimus westermani]|uniref:C2H2-type domain-containing protein n=1 Tax=Paragonimus westermani TaxID=34504 RepID=A0A8T0DQK3_9TREM|nr:hypothetical protein P879_05397 [Paragonimus westermani]